MKTAINSFFNILITLINAYDNDGAAPRIL